MRILWVENNERFARVTIQHFFQEDEVVVVPTVVQAREQISQQHMGKAFDVVFDVVLVDYDLDDGKGDVVIGIIRESWPKIPIVAVSPHNFGNLKMSECGANAICSKLHFSSIRSTIEALL